MNITELQNTFGSRSKALEILLLLHNMKPVVRQGFYDNELWRLKDFCKLSGLALELAPYKVVLADADRRYSNKGFKARVDDPRKGMYFAYISKEERLAAEAKVLEMKNDHRRLGEALGYPSCCAEFFAKHFPVRSRLDNDYSVCTAESSKGVIYPFLTNVLNRQHDVVLLSHFPCSFECEHSIAMGKKAFKLLEDVDPSLAMHYAHSLKGRFKVGNKDVEFS